jgi:hypothetical protein
MHLAPEEEEKEGDSEGKYFCRVRKRIARDSGGNRVGVLSLVGCVGYGGRRDGDGGAICGGRKSGS